MARFTVVGSGVTGTGVTTQLADAGHEVTVVTRHGTGPRREGVRLVAADATDLEVLTTLTSGSAALFNCANPPYHRWLTDWPPLAAAMLTAAERTGATLVILGNLYPYGVPTGPMTPHDPLRATYAKAQVRAQMWRDARSAHDDGLVRAVEVRASDFIGASANSVLGERVVPRVLEGKRCTVVGDPDVTHSWTYVGDVATTMVAVATDPTSWGRAWHVPTNPPRSSREAINDLADAAGVARVAVSAVPRSVLRAGGLFSPLLRELPKTLYQFEVPFVIDDQETRQHFGLAPTAWDEVLAATLAPYRALAAR